MQEDVFGYLIDDIERFFDESGWQFELLEYFSPLVVLLEDDAVDLLGGQQKLVKLQSVCAADDDKLLVVVGCIGVEVEPLELDDGIGVHPLRGDFSVEAELLDLDGSELIQIFSGVRIQKHAYLGSIIQEVLIL